MVKSHIKFNLKSEMTLSPLTPFPAPLHSVLPPPLTAQPSFLCLQRVFAWILALIIHCFQRTQWIPIHSYCESPSSRLIATPKVINFILGDVPANVNDRRSPMTPKLRFNLLAALSEPLQARWDYAARFRSLLSVLLICTLNNITYGFLPTKKKTFTKCIDYGPVFPEGAMATVNVKIITWNISAI